MDSPRIFGLPSPQGGSASKNSPNWPFRVTGLVLFLFAPSTPSTHCEFAALSPAHGLPPSAITELEAHRLAVAAAAAASAAASVAASSHAASVHEDEGVMPVVCADASVAPLE